MMFYLKFEDCYLRSFTPAVIFIFIIYNSLLVLKKTELNP